MELVSKDIKFGYQFPISMESAEKIKNGVKSPYDIVDHTKFSEFGERTPRQILTPTL